MIILIQFLVVVAAIAVVSCILVFFDRKRLRTLAAKRREETICTFVRALEYRRLDTRIIRAVYEELQLYFSYAHQSLPLRPTDRFCEDLDFDQGDLEDLTFDVAKKCGLNMCNVEANPHFGKVVTISDLIELLCAQPKMP